MREPRAHTSEELLFTRGVPNARSPERPETKAVEDTLLELLRTRNAAACEIKREARGEDVIVKDVLPDKAQARDFGETLTCLGKGRKNWGRMLIRISRKPAKSTFLRDRIACADRKLSM